MPFEPPTDLVEPIRQLAAAVKQLAVAIEQQAGVLGSATDPRYTRPPAEESALVDEGSMAKILNISRRTLGTYRRQGRLPGCWLRNGGRVLWRVAETTSR